MKLWQFIKQQYDFVIRTAGTPVATRLMLLYSALESIIIPIPVDPLLVAVVLAKSNQWRRVAFACTVASVLGGAGGWALGAYLGLHIHALIDSCRSMRGCANLNMRPAPSHRLHQEPTQRCRQMQLAAIGLTLLARQLPKVGRLESE